MLEEIIVYIWRGVITTGIASLIWLLNWQRRVESRLTEIQTRIEKDIPTRGGVEQHAQRISVLEQQIASLSIGDDVRQLHERINEIVQTTHAQQGEMTQIARNVQMIMDHLLHR